MNISNRMPALLAGVFLAVFGASGLQAQPLTLQDAGLSEIESVPAMELQALDREALLEEDARREADPGVAPRFAIPHPVMVSPASDGLWEEAEDGTRVWRYRIHAPEARSINLAFSQYRLPEGAELHLFSEDGKRSIRPFTAADNKPHGELWTPVFEGETMVLELQVPADARDAAVLELASVNYGYRGFYEVADTRSGSCNVDVACPEGDDWPYEISSVAVISTGGSTFCTGFMVNNVESDGTPFFMTADHCGVGPGDAASLVTHWNYENSTCREPDTPEAGGPGDGSLDEFNTGSTFRASGAASDFTLVELDEEPDPEWEVGYAGWDARDQATDWAIAIHHPSTQEKRISFEYDPTTITDYLSDAEDPDETHIRVNDWDVGTTEPGSSGSPLFSPEGRVVGQLHGGYAACGNNDPDWYGRIAYSWDGASESDRLRDWLDPEDTGTLFVDGLGQGGFALVPDSESISQCSFDDVDLTIDVEAMGDFEDDVDLSVEGLPDGVSSEFSVNPVTPPTETVLSLGGLETAGVGTFEFSLVGESDEHDDSVSISVTLSDEAPGIADIVEPEDGEVGVGVEPEVSWTEASQAAAYELEVATDEEFEDVVYATTVTGTSHQVEEPLDTSTDYYLRVRATNECDTADWSAPVNFVTEAEPGDCPVGSDEASLLSEDFAEGEIPDDWSTEGSKGEVTWVISDDESYSGDFSVFAENIASVSDQRLALPAMELPDDALSMYLNFYNWQHIESGGGTGCYDGGLLEVSTDGGGSWDPVEEQIIEREYDGTINPDFGNPLAGLPAWCGDPRDSWERYTVDMTDWAGQEVSFRLRFGTDSSVDRVGWHVDNVDAVACTEPPPPEIFEDRFEAGDER